MANKYIIQRRTASGLETVAEIPALEGNKVDMSWLPVVGSMGSAIIERGDNANGEYIRWADGTQICTRTVTLTFSATTATGAFYFARFDGYTYPAAFIDIPQLFLGFSDLGTTNRGGIPVQSGDASPTQTSDFYIFKQIKVTNYSGLFHYLAIGHWK